MQTRTDVRLCGGIGLPLGRERNTYELIMPHVPALFSSVAWYLVSIPNTPILRLFALSCLIDNLLRGTSKYRIFIQFCLYVPLQLKMLDGARSLKDV